jgi:hypothetical protein
VVQVLPDFRDSPTRPSPSYPYRFWLKAVFGKKEMASALTYRLVSEPLAQDGVLDRN